MRRVWGQAPQMLLCRQTWCLWCSSSFSSSGGVRQAVLLGQEVVLVHSRTLRVVLLGGLH